MPLYLVILHVDLVYRSAHLYSGVSSFHSFKSTQPARFIQSLSQSAHRFSCFFSQEKPLSDESPLLFSQVQKTACLVVVHLNFINASTQNE